MKIEQASEELQKYLSECIQNETIDEVRNYTISINNGIVGGMFVKKGISYNIKVSCDVAKEDYKLIEEENKDLQICLYAFKLRLEGEIKIAKEQAKLKKSISAINNEEDFLNLKIKMAEEDENYEEANKLKKELAKLKKS